MSFLSHTYHRLERFIGNVKFAVVIILLFAVALAWGTFVESWHGADYANRLVYKSLWFMGIQFFMFLSILFATLIRLPFKRNLAGFYVIHFGLMLIFLGSFLTYATGVDGSLVLMPNQPARTVGLNSDLFSISGMTPGREILVQLPFNARPADLEFERRGVKLGRYLPFAEKKVNWIASAGQRHISTYYQIFTENFGESFLLSLHPESSFPNTTQLGPLNLHYLPPALYHCFNNPVNSSLFIWNTESQKCETILHGQVKMSQVSGKLLADVSFSQGSVKFFPQISPFPLDQSQQTNQSSPLRIFDRRVFEKGAHLFLFGESGVYFDKNVVRWVPLRFENQVASLPWMGMKLSILKHESSNFPVERPEFITPVQESGKISAGELKAMEVQVGAKKIWVTSDGPVSLKHEGQEIVFEFRKKNITLPYEITLEDFRMQNDPGTNNPASYESFVTIFRGNQGSSRHHVFMNNPLKVDSFTFYQSSYFEAGKGSFGSVFSVNYDPGRPWKYLGSFLLVFGSAWHYLLLAARRRKPT